MERNWVIQYEPRGALRAAVLRYLSPDKEVSFTRLSRAVFDDFTAVTFWDRCDPPERGRPKVFCHALGSMYMDTRRKRVSEDLTKALESLQEDGVVTPDSKKKKYSLTSYSARALWLAKMPKNVLTVYVSLPATHPDTDNWMEGMDIFSKDGTLKDKRDETIRQQTLEIKKLKVDLKAANGWIKIYRERSEGRRAVSLP